jgi:DNA-binding MarR family transcriptional regulator
MTSGTDGRPDHVLALLGYLMDDFRRELNERVRSVDLPGAPAGTRSLRGSQVRLLSLTPSEGMRVTDLAEKLGMTKQSLGELATALESLGFLESVRDPADRRGRNQRPPPDGLSALAAAQRVIEQVEEEYRTRYGTRRWDTLRDILREITDAPTEGPATP